MDSGNRTDLISQQMMTARVRWMVTYDIDGDRMISIHSNYQEAWKVANETAAAISVHRVKQCRGCGSIIGFEEPIGSCVKCR